MIGRILLSQSCEDDLDFVSPLAEEVKCPFHGGILQDPVIGPCGHSFCKTCLQMPATLNENDIFECPLCLEPLSEPFYPNNFAIAVISKLLVRCHLRPDCGAIIHLGELAIHKSICNAEQDNKLSPRKVFKQPSLHRMEIPKMMGQKVPWEIDFRELKLLYRIGIGAFGEVFKATFRGTYVAVKRVLAVGKNEQERFESFSKELNYMKAVRHPNVILFVGACLQRSNMCIVIEYMEGGSLREQVDNIYKEKGPIPWNTFIRWCIDAATGLAYLHGQNMIHRDVKSNNLLIADGKLKVADFGLARMADHTDKSQAGNWAWMAPVSFFKN